MGLLDPALLTPSLAPDQALNRAEALVTAAICPGLPELKVRQWVVNYQFRNESRGLGVPNFGRRRLGPTVLRSWPITGLVSVMQQEVQGGVSVDLTADCSFDTFSIRRDALSPEFLPLGNIQVTFQTGWTISALPVAIREAILLTARTLLNAPDGIQSERIDEVNVQYVRSADPTGLPAAALVMLAPWRFIGS